MSLVINTNISSMIAQQYLGQATSNLQSATAQLSSGLRINKASDDAAGLALSQSLQSQINGDNQASNNVQDGINVMNIADGALSTIQNNLQRMRELAVQASNDTYSVTQRTAMQTEYNQLASGITQISTAAQFNGISLFSAGSTLANLQIGANTTANVDEFNVASLFTTPQDATSLGVAASTLSSSANAQTAITALDTAIDSVSTTRANIGASTNRLQSTAENLTTSVTNLTASQSQILDVNVATASAKMAQQQVLQQAAVAMLTQANQSPSLALSLIKNA
jgi:flagellin